MSTGSTLISLIASRQNLDDYQKKHWVGSFAEYLDIIQREPEVTRTAYQRIYDMIISHGTEEVVVNKEKLIRYKFFEDPENQGQDAIFGLERTLMNFVNILKSAANGYGTERRVLLLHGPVGSSKSTLARLLKKGLERFSRVDEGGLYSFSWKEEGSDGEEEILAVCPMHEEPLHLIPQEHRAEVTAALNKGRGYDDFQVTIEGDLCPFCRQMFNERMERYGGDWGRVVQDVRVRRLILSEQDRIGIGTFQPKDEKNQDATELTGDINYRKIAEYGTESDPRAFNFDGEFNIANRGIIEFIEVLKLDVAFLYDLLGASQEHKIKPKKFAQTDIDEVIIGHTNEPEYKKLQSNEFMEALRDRTVKIDVPYVTRLADEIKIYEKDYNSRKVRGKRLAPHTLEVAAMWAVLTRLEEPKNAGLTLVQKLKLYNGKTLPGFTEDNIKELREEAEREGMHGISPRYVQDKISNALVAHPDERSINPFMVLNELETGLKHHSLINSDQIRRRYANEQTPSPKVAQGTGLTTAENDDAFHVVLVIHGIRTQADWGPMIRSKLEVSGKIEVIPIRYGYFDAFRFWFPIWTRNKPIERVYKQIRVALQKARRDRPDAKLSCIAHSFGAYVVGEIVKREFDLKIHRLVLCGSVLPQDFPWEQYQGRFDDVVNECGKSDIWPVLAQSLSWLYGASGTHGFFNEALVQNRFHPGGHAQYFDPKFVELYWEPLIRRGLFMRTDYEVKMPTTPWWISVLGNLPLQWITIALITAALIAASLHVQGMIFADKPRPLVLKKFFPRTSWLWRAA